jgi:iron-sulfur cluster assembly accessory protein
VEKMADRIEGTTLSPAHEPPVRLSELAAQKVREFIAQDELVDPVLRVSVLPGGCSGFEYGLNLDENVREDDVVFEAHGVRVAVDPFSVQYLAGVSIDYQSSFKGSGFTFENPNATGSCGCGTSFAV